MNHASNESRRLANQDFEQSLQALESLFVPPARHVPAPPTNPPLSDDGWNWTDQELDEDFPASAIAPEETA